MSQGTESSADAPLRNYDEESRNTIDTGSLILSAVYCLGIQIELSCPASELARPDRYGHDPRRAKPGKQRKLGTQIARSATARGWGINSGSHSLEAWRPCSCKPTAVFVPFARIFGSSRAPQCGDWAALAFESVPRSILPSGV